MHILLRMVATAVMAVLPTLFFLAFWRGLMALRDDDLARQVKAMEERERRAAVTGRASGSNGPLGDLLDGVQERTAPGTCPECGVENREEMDYCRNCLAELPER